MATFPSIAPNSRLYVPGSLPAVIATSLNGRATAFRRGNRRIAQTLSLTYEYLTEANMALIKDHYIGQNGTFEIFFLSAEVWGDFVTPPIPLLSDFAWKYSSEVTITDVSFDRFSVSVDLESVPINTGDLVFDAGAAAATPVRMYVIDAGAAAATPARDYIISPSGAS
jgi:hypothetical protein